MLTTCFGLPLQAGTGIIAITNAISLLFFIIYYTWKYSINYGYSFQERSTLAVKFSDQTLFNDITLLFMVIGFVSLFANFGLKQATLKNGTHKIYLWLVMNYVLLVTVIAIEADFIYRSTLEIKNVVRYVICFTLFDAILGYQLLVVQSFYAQEKLVKENNYNKLSSELASEEDNGEFQNVEL